MAVGAVGAVGVHVSAGEERRAYDDAAIHQSCVAVVADAAFPLMFIHQVQDAQTHVRVGE